MEDWINNFIAKITTGQLSEGEAINMLSSRINEYAGLVKEEVLSEAIEIFSKLTEDDIMTKNVVILELKNLKSSIQR